jgi:hypothetical protein
MTRKSVIGTDSRFERGRTGADERSGCAQGRWVSEFLGIRPARTARYISRAAVPTLLGVLPDVSVSSQAARSVHVARCDRAASLSDGRAHRSTTGRRPVCVSVTVLPLKVLPTFAPRLDWDFNTLGTSVGVEPGQAARNRGSQCR